MRVKLVIALALMSYGCYVNILSAGKGKIMNQLTGYIETTFDGAIQKINLPTDKMEVLFKKNTNNYNVTRFDVSPDGKDRILEISAFRRFNETDLLVLFSNNKDFKTLLSKNFVRQPTYSPDGKRIAYLYKEPGKEPKKNCYSGWYLYLINSDGTNNREISDNCFAEYRPTWFPDSKRLAISTQDLKIYIINTEPREETKIIDFGWAPSVSRDGNRIAYLSKEVVDSDKKKMIEYSNTPLHEIFIEKNDERSQMEYGKLFQYESFYLYNIETGKSKKISKDFWVEERAIWSPDDKYLLFNDRRAVSNDIYVLDTKTGEAEEISSHKGRVMTWRK